MVSTGLAHAFPTPKEPPAECYCAECGMEVKGAGKLLASEIIFKDGKVQFFCDLGDLFLYYEVLKDKSGVAAVYVHDYPSKAWVNGQTASYLSCANVKTPMGFKILAFKDKAGAEKFKKEKGGGAIYSFTEMMTSKIYKR